MIFLDTSVLIATAQVSHARHAPSRELWNQCVRHSTAISTHTMAEVYNTLTADEYMETLRRTANLGRSGGMIYDALLLACARKVQAERIYTWNVKHFQTVAPDLADRIMTP